MSLAQTLGANVRRLRQERGQSLEAFADEVGLAYTYVGQIERGKRNPTLGVVERLAAALAVAPLALLSEESEGGGGMPPSGASSEKEVGGR